MEPIKILIIVVLFAIVGSLGSALFHLSRGKGDSKKMARALTVRIGLSVALFILLMLAWYAGLIKPHGRSGQHSAGRNPAKSPEFGAFCFTPAPPLRYGSPPMIRTTTNKATKTKPNGALGSRAR